MTTDSFLLHIVWSPILLCSHGVWFVKWAHTPLSHQSLSLFYETKPSHISYKPTNLCKLENYQSGPLDADLMDVVRGLKRKKRPTGGRLKRKKRPPLIISIRSASSDPD